MGRGSGFNENVADVVSSNMDGVGNTSDAENTFGGARQHAFGGIKPSTRRLLNLLDLAASLPNHASHTRVGDDELNRNGSTSRDRRNVEWLVVNAANDKTESLGDSVKSTADVENSLWISRNALRDHDFGTALFPDLVDMAACLANDDRCILSNDQATHVNSLGRSAWSGIGRIASFVGVRHVGVFILLRRFCLSRRRYTLSRLVPLVSRLIGVRGRARALSIVWHQYTLVNHSLVRIAMSGMRSGPRVGCWRGLGRWYRW